MIPGPTNVDPEVLRALSRPTEAHTSPYFTKIFKEAIDSLRKIMFCGGYPFIVAGSGTLAMEMAIANVVEADDRVLVVSNGYFSERFCEIIEGYGAVVDRLEVEWGDVADPMRLRERLEKGRYKAVTVTHVDTSTGAASPAAKIGDVLKDFDALYILDTVCSLGGMEVRVDDWHVDVCVSGSQKALAIPPGLAIVAASERAIEAYKKRKTKVSFYYGSFGKWIPIMEDPSKYFATPPVNMIYAFQRSLQGILEEGLERRFRRHEVMAAAFRSAMEALGLRLVARTDCAASTVSAVHYPEGAEDEGFRKAMSSKYHVVVAGGIGKLKGKVFRVGHMGNVNMNDIVSTVSAVERSLGEQGRLKETGLGLRAANNVLAQFT